jgi:CBS domain-containing protein
MKVKNVMTRKVIMIKKGMTYEEVVKVFLKKKISGAPVVDEAGKLIGLVSEKDLFRVLYPFYKSFYECPELYCDFEERENKIEEIKDHLVESFMTKEVMTVTPETPIMSTGALMLARGIHRLPVMENDEIVGLVSREDIYRRIFRKKLSAKKKK